MKILVQIQSSKWAKDMVEALAHGGFNDLLGPVKTVEISRKHFNDGYSHRHVSVTGLEVNGVRVNDFWIYLQFPNNNKDTADNAALAMVNGLGLRLWLGPYCKNIVCSKKSETNVGAFEELGAGIVVS